MDLYRFWLDLVQVRSPAEHAWNAWADWCLTWQLAVMPR